jgi:hypothetical protein
MRTETPRAKRLTLTAPITYRLTGSDDWLRGRVLNISESGVMFGPTAVDSGCSIEVIFSTPISIESLPPGKLICIAEVVRTTPAGTAAARFAECRFLIGA